jgi:UDP-N-acetylmuramoyl-tripeptide--D-alanyl-D-alanine ligase
MINSTDIKNLADLVRPNIAIITNIGSAHLQKLGSKENIFNTKMEITDYFNEDNILIINSDDQYLSTIVEKPYKIIKISTKGLGDYNAFDIVNLGEAGVQFKCKYRNETLLLRMAAVGVHNVYNALAAIAVADLFDLDSEQIKTGILKFKPSELRMNIIRLKNNVTIIEDCYNASPDSMKSSIDVLDSFAHGRRIAILGDMLELGDYSIEAHKEIGNYLIDKCDMLVAVGHYSKYIAENSSPNIATKYFSTVKEACKHLEQLITAGDILLVKGSRSMEMEKIAEYLTNNTKL